MRTAAMPVAKRDSSLVRTGSGSNGRGRELLPPRYGIDLLERPGRLQLKARVGAANDPLEREADRLADAVMSGGIAGPVSRAAPDAAQRACASCGGEEERIQRKCAACEEETVRRAPGTAARSGSAQAAASAVSSGGAPLPAASRAFFGARFGRDFGDVRIHAGASVGAAALGIGARAYTLGTGIAFAPGEYAPDRPSGQRLLAHELAHVVQQGGAGDTIRRTELEILPADSTGTPKAAQRRAAASCAISCGGKGGTGNAGKVGANAAKTIGTLHAMSLFFHASRAAPLANATGADGIGTSLHFIRNGEALAAGHDCAACSDWKVIQTVHTNAPLGGKPERYVDNNGSAATPFYDDVWASGAGLHAIPAGYPDSGDQFRTTKSIYDRPFRANGALTGIAGKDFFWNAEACVTCVKPGKDKVLGCATYGFRRPWVPAPAAPGGGAPAPGAPPAGSYGSAEGVGPGCRASPSAEFVATIKGDSSTSTYDFET